MPSDKPVILVTRKLPPDVEARCARDYEARLNADDHHLSEAELASGLDGADGVITASSTHWPRERIMALPERVRILTTFSVGYEHIDLEAARERGLAVGNTPEVLTEAVADIAMLCLLGAARRAHEGATMLRGGNWIGWESMQLVGMELQGRKLGIVGMGRIGQAIARRARGFGLEIHYHNRRRLEPALEAGAVFHETLDSLLQTAHIVQLACPATPETVNMMNRETFARMRPGSILVNTARGNLVDEDALMEALDSGQLFAAGLDVFRNEPKVDPRLFERTNLFAVPHVGSATLDTRNAMGYCCLANLDAFFQGKPLPYGLVP